jgi:hypothetical protein
MKKYLLWTFERGSRPYDVIVVVILAFILLTPPSAFHDRPDFVPVASDLDISQANDDDGHPVWVVKVKVKTEQDAVDRTKASLGEAVTISRKEPVYDATGSLVAYSIWVVR